MESNLLLFYFSRQYYLSTAKPGKVRLSITYLGSKDFVRFLVVSTGKVN